MRCDIVRCDIKWCDLVQCVMMQYFTESTVRLCTIRYGEYGAIRYGRYDTVCTTLYGTMQYHWSIRSGKYVSILCDMMPLVQCDIVQ